MSTVAGRLRLLVPLARAGYGAALLCAPGPMIGVVTGQPPSRRARRVARVLGVRHLAQAAITALNPGPEVVALGVIVDLLHAASMFAFAAVVPDLRDGRARGRARRHRAGRRRAGPVQRRPGRRQPVVASSEPKTAEPPDRQAPARLLALRRPGNR